MVARSERVPPPRKPAIVGSWHLLQLSSCSTRLWGTALRVHAQWDSLTCLVAAAHARLFRAQASCAAQLPIAMICMPLALLSA